MLPCDKIYQVTCSSYVKIKVEDNKVALSILKTLPNSSCGFQMSDHCTVLLVYNLRATFFIFCTIHVMHVICGV